MNNVISNQMEVSVFIENIQKAFGEKVQLPLHFGILINRLMMI